jgi:hypothetical protein
MFKKLEYFSVRQQELYPMELGQESEELSFIEAIVRQWMFKNKCRKLAHLHDLSRIGGTSDRGFYQD